ncbi:hypothetical protein EYF80_009570 [Liparis tanakae]|uniref:Uncharacterized protein n=1 Tax=Liparis tanakae TaxID=230148 RepID=A0A4Z2IQQ4_9TELE|nr:hypothetical protein EYF80_009570 [Liparis tanakae]
MERRGADKLVVDGELHRDQRAQQQIDAQRDGTGTQLGDDVILGAVFCRLLTMDAPLPEWRTLDEGSLCLYFPFSLPLAFSWWRGW